MTRITRRARPDAPANASVDRAPPRSTGAPLQRRRHRGFARPAAQRASGLARRGPDGGVQGAGAARSLDRGPTPDRAECDGVSGWRAKDLCRLVEDRFGVRYSENGMLQLRKSLDLSRQKARPSHPEADLEAQAALKKIPRPDRRSSAARARRRSVVPGCLNAKSSVQAHRPDRPRRPVDRGWGPDRRYARGVRPRGQRDLRHQAVYLFGAVCPERDAGVALVLPTVGSTAMQAMLDELSQAVTPGAQAVVVMDRAGWHVAAELNIPDNLTPLGGSRAQLAPAAPLTAAQRHRAGRSGPLTRSTAVPPRALPLILCEGARGWTHRLGRRDHRGRGQHRRSS